MIIIIEGIDRVGKTTLCEKLSNEYNYIRYRDDQRYFGNYNNRNVNTEKINTLMNLIENGIIKNIILDRYHLTEYIYGFLERKYENKEMFDIDERLSKLDVILILMTPTDIEESSRQHGSDLSVYNEMFVNFYNNSKIKNKIILDYKKIDNIVDFIERIKNER